MNCSEQRTVPPAKAARLAILIAFATVDAARGGEPVRLTTDGTLELSPVFIDRGDEIAFASHESPNLVAIVLIKLSDGTRRRMHPSVVDHQFDPAFSGDWRLHAYARSSTAPQTVLVIQNTHDKKESVFRPRESRATVRNPFIAPDGSRVVFSLSDVGGHQISSVSAQAHDLKRLTDAAGMNAWPAYSPDAQKIAFASSRTGDFEIYLMNADGSHLNRLTRSPGLDVRPAWSHDGARLAFTSNRDGNYEIYLMNTDGSHLRNVTSHPARDDHPAWHPDGRLLFVSDRDGGSDLYLDAVPFPPPVRLHTAKGRKFPMKVTSKYLRRDPAEVAPWAETCGQIRPLVEEKDEAAAEIHHVEIDDAKLHYHARTDEFYYVIDGQGTMVLDDEIIELHRGVVVYVPRGTRHKAVGKLTVLTICIPPGVLNDIHEVE